MVKLTNAQVLDAYSALQRLMQMKFHVLTSYKLVKLAQVLKPFVESSNEIRVSLQQKYGEKNERGQYVIPPMVEKKDADGKTVLDDKEQPVMVPNPNLEAGDNEWKELLKQEVKADIEKITLPEKIASTCDKCHNNMDKPLEIEPSLLLPLADFIEME